MTVTVVLMALAVYGIFLGFAMILFNHALAEYHPKARASKVSGRCKPCYIKRLIHT